MRVNQKFLIISRGKGGFRFGSEWFMVERKKERNKPENIRGPHSTQLR